MSSQDSCPCEQSKPRDQQQHRGSALVFTHPAISHTHIQSHGRSIDHSTLPNQGACTELHVTGVGISVPQCPWIQPSSCSDATRNGRQPRGGVQVFTILRRQSTEGVGSWMLRLPDSKIGIWRASWVHGLFLKFRSCQRERLFWVGFFSVGSGYARTVPEKPVLLNKM
jgi:hypothetical protein